MKLNFINSKIQPEKLKPALWENDQRNLDPFTPKDGSPTDRQDACIALNVSFTYVLTQEDVFITWDRMLFIGRDNEKQCEVNIAK